MKRIVWLSTGAAAILALALTLPVIAQDHHIGEPGLTAPRLIYRVEPQYTEEARSAKLAGTVILKIVVDEQGNAENIEVTKSLDEGLDQKAVEAVRAWRFAPGTKDGEPVRVVASVEVNFRLN
jgi:periplasmic protein TonB